MLDRQRGEQSVSGYFADLLRERDTRGEPFPAPAPATPRTAALSPRLEKARVQHAMSYMERPPYTVTAGPTKVTMNKRVYQDLDLTGNKAFPIHHEIEIPRGDEVRSEEHYLDAACPACRDVLRTFRG